jgi:drug/metabolite transporter (DMT)-like permease
MRAVSKVRGLAPILALMFNALVWGTSWWPFRRLESHALHPLWTTVIVYLLAAAVIGVLRPRAFVQVATTPALWVLMLASGITNAAFNWGVVIGDVVRVVLLFYLMPLWTVLLARLLLHEPLTAAAGVRVAMALGGALIVLRPAGGVLSLPSSLADWQGVLGGFSIPEESRALAMFVGGVLVAGTLAITLASQAAIAWPPLPAPGWTAIALALATLFLLSNLALQYGASRLPANVTAVVMLSEVVFASASAIALGGGRLTLPVVLGGGLIVGAALLSARSAPAAH